MLIRQTLVVFGSVSPSAASTQVVPNGGKRKETRLRQRWARKALIFATKKNK